MQDSLSASEKELLRELTDGTLRRKANEAITVFGHGAVKDENGRVIHLDVSTGGFTRELLDNFQQPSPIEVQRMVRGK